MTTEIDIPAQTAKAAAAFGAGRYAEAAGALRRVLASRPTDDVARLNLALALDQTGQADEASALLADVLTRWPEQPHALFHLARLTAPRDRRGAELLLLRLLKVQQSYPHAAQMLGTMLLQRGEAVAAEHLLRMAVMLEPGSGPALNNLGGSIMTQVRPDAAEPWYRRAVAVAPAEPDPHKNLAGCLLQQGQLAEGWAEYDWRWRWPGWPWRREFPGTPMWRGETLAGRTVLVHTEQGLGDAFQFVRYLARLRALGARTILECDRAMVRVLASAPGIDHLVARGDPLPPFDVYTPLMSVPRYCSPTADGIPTEIPYLQAEPALTARWRARMEPARLRIGIHWQSSVLGGKSIPLSAFAPLAELPDVRLYSLQRRDGLDQLDGWGSRLGIVDWPDADSGPDAFLDTAAILASLDLVVCCDSSVAHLAGALGVRTFLLLPRLADWRWMNHPTRTAWYPRTRLFRCSRPDGWEEVMALVADRVRRDAARLGGRA